jgi:putative ABC transport system permease protein
MKYVPLIWAGLWRKKVRTILTFLSVVVAFILFGILAGVSGGFDHQLSISRLDRLFTDPKFGTPLPLAYQTQIEAVPGVKIVAPRMGLGGYYRERKNGMGVIMTDARFFGVRTEIQVKKADIDAMIQDRQGAIVGIDLAKQYGWKVGDKIPLISTIPTKDGSNVWTFDIIATVADSDRATSTWFVGNYRYLDDRRAKGGGKSDRFLIIVNDPKRGTQIAQAIDNLFVNSPYPTRSGTDRANAESGLRSLGDINFFTHAIIGAVLFMLLFLTGNTMMQSVRERVPEFAVMKTVGFSDGAVLGLVLAEAVMLCLLAGVTGLVLVKTILPMVAKGSQNIASILVLPWSSFGWGLFFALLMAGLAAYFPAMKVRRLSVVDALRR